MAVGFYMSHNNHITELLLEFLHAEKRSHRPSWFAILDKRTPSSHQCLAC
jgi:hypothetical protein